MRKVLALTACYLLLATCLPAQVKVTTCGSTSSQVATPAYNNDTGSYASTVSVTITDATGGAAITYCTNVGSDCNPVGQTAYTVPVVITVTATHLCSYATHSAMTDSATKCGTYTITSGTPENIGNTATATVLATSSGNVDYWNAAQVTTGANAAGYSINSCSLAMTTATGYNLRCAIFDAVTPYARLCYSASTAGADASVNTISLTTPCTAITLSASHAYWVGWNFDNSAAAATTYISDASPAWTSNSYLAGAFASVPPANYTGQSTSGEYWKITLNVTPK